MFINDNRNREEITHESCDDREFREVVGIGASTDRYNFIYQLFQFDFALLFARKTFYIKLTLIFKQNL